MPGSSTEDGREVVAGSGELGRLALRGRGPTGYYKDPDKTAATFQMIDGERWTIPGDFATVDKDGTARLLGRGSGCINTGGEKVFPEEVEEALKLHPAVADAVVVGTPDDRFGEAVTAVVEPRPGREGLDESALIGWVEDPAGCLQGPPPGGGRGHHRQVSERQGRLPPAAGLCRRHPGGHQPDSPPGPCRGDRVRRERGGGWS